MKEDRFIFKKRKENSVFITLTNKDRKAKKNMIGFLTFGIIFLSSILALTIFYEGAFDPSNPQLEEVFETNPSLFPSNQFTNITNVKFIEGEWESGSITDLQKLDGRRYNVKGTNFDIRFQYDADTENFLLDSFDLFLYFQTNGSINDEIIWFQANSCQEWVNISVVSDLPININRRELSGTTEFRLYGTTSTAKRISIDRLCFFFKHPEPYPSENIILHDSLINITHDNVTRYVDYYPATMVSNVTYNDNWWANATDNLTLTHFGSVTQYHYNLGMFTYLDIDIHLDPGIITNVKNITKFLITFQVNITPDPGIYTHIWPGTYILLWRYTTEDYLFVYANQTHENLITFDIAEYLNSLQDEPQYYNYNYFIKNNILKLQIYTRLNKWFPELDYNTVNTTVRLDYLDIEVEAEGYNFEKYDYPNFNPLNLNTTIPVPIEDNFTIQGNTIPCYNSSIESVEFLIKNETWITDWVEMSNASDNLWETVLNGTLFQPYQTYIMWLKIIDNSGKMTYLYIEFYNTILTYHLTDSIITYQMSGVEIYPNQLNYVPAQAVISQDPFFNNPHFLTILSDNYLDGKNFYIKRNLTYYLPYLVDGVRMRWNLPSFQEVDEMEFEIEGPTITNTLNNERELEFTLSSSRNYDDVIMINKIGFKTDKEHSKVYYLVPPEGDPRFFKPKWIEIDVDQYSVEYDDLRDVSTFRIKWYSILAGSETSFRVTVGEISETELNLILIVSIVIGGVVAIGIGIYIWKRKVKSSRRKSIRPIKIAEKKSSAKESPKPSKEQLFREFEEWKQMRLKS